MKNIFPQTLSLYLIKEYTLNFILLLFGLLSIIYLFDTVELLRRASKFENIPVSLVLQMGLYKLPEIGQLLFPFAVLFSAMFTFWKLTRQHELVIIRSAGLSIWQFLAPIISVVLLIGVLQITLINPLGALFIAKYEKLENQHLERGGNAIMLSGQGLWLRQENPATKETAIIHAKRIQMPQWELQNIIIFIYSKDNKFTYRVDSPSAKLLDKNWVFATATANQSGQPPAILSNLKLPTNLTIKDLEESFASPETISFWKLPSYIKIMEETGLNSNSLKVHFQNLLSQPLLFVAMILLAASVSLSPSRMQNTAVLILLGIAIGFIIFFASSFLQALGASQQVPIIISAWFPAIISFLFGVGALMTLEDG